MLMIRIRKSKRQRPENMSSVYTFIQHDPERYCLEQYGGPPAGRAVAAMIDTV